MKLNYHLTNGYFFSWGNPRDFRRIVANTLLVSRLALFWIFRIFQLVGGFKLLFFHPYLGETIQFDEHIFQTRWNHQLVKYSMHVRSCWSIAVVVVDVRNAGSAWLVWDVLGGWSNFSKLWSLFLPWHVIQSEDEQARKIKRPRACALQQLKVNPLQNGWLFSHFMGKVEW